MRVGEGRDIFHRLISNGLFLGTGVCILPFISFDWSQFGPSYGLSAYMRRIFFFTARIVINAGTASIVVAVPPFAARQIEAYGVTEIRSCFH